MSIFDIIAAGNIPGSKAAVSNASALQDMAMQRTKMQSDLQNRAFNQSITSNQEARAAEQLKIQQAEEQRKADEAKRQERLREQRKALKEKHPDRAGYIDALLKMGDDEGASQAADIFYKRSLAKEADQRAADKKIDDYMQVAGQGATALLDSGNINGVGAFIENLSKKYPNQAKSIMQDLQGKSPQQVTDYIRQIASQSKMYFDMRKKEMDVAAKKAKSTKPQKTPSLTERKMATDRLTQLGEIDPKYEDLKDDLGKTGFNDLSTKLASAAKKAVSENEGLTFDEAMDSLMQDVLDKNLTSKEKWFGFAEEWSFKKKDKEQPKQGAGDEPPMAGAQKAPDGKWYIKKDGEWYRID